MQVFFFSQEQEEFLEKGCLPVLWQAYLHDMLKGNELSIVGCSDL